MRVSEAFVSRYRNDLSARQLAAQEFVMSMLRAFAETRPDASTAELREFGKLVLDQAYRFYGDAGAARAAQLYDALASSLFPGGGIETAKIENSVEADKIDRDVRYLVGIADAGDFASFAARMASKASDHVMRAANSTVVSNAERDGGRGIRYARVPSGRETCGFCLMLASHGFTYTTKRAAGDIGLPFNSFHDHCDCIVLPGTDDTEVEGYDPDYLLEVYADARATVEPGLYAEWRSAGGKDGTGKTYDKYLRDRIAKEIETRDREWAWTGKACSVSKEAGAKPWKKERDVADALVEHGFNVRFVREPKDSKIFDAYLNDVPWEFKIPEAWNDKTIKNQFKKATGKGTSRLLVSGSLNGSTLDEMAGKVGEILASDDFDEITEVLLMDPEGSIRRMIRR